MERGKLGKNGEVGENLPKCLTEANELDRRTPSEAANLAKAANLGKMGNLAKIYQRV